MQPQDFQEGQVVERDHVAMAQWPCPDWQKCGIECHHQRRCAGNRNLAILEARRRAPLIGQVVEVTHGGHVDVIWENGRWTSHGNSPWLAPLEGLKP